MGGTSSTVEKDEDGSVVTVCDRCCIIFPAIIIADRCHAKYVPVLNNSQYEICTEFVTS